MIVESIQMNAATPIGFNNSFEGEPVEDPEDVYDISDLDEDWHNNWIIKDIGLINSLKITGLMNSEFTCSMIPSVYP